MTDTTHDFFVSELKHWRDVRGHSQSALAKRMAYDRTYLSKIESGAERPSAEFATRADQVLEAGGAIARAFRDLDRLRDKTSARQVAPKADVLGPGLVVEHDDAELVYDDGIYIATQRRQLHNVGTEPVTRYLIRISVDRFPGAPERSNQLYRENPLTWDALQLHAASDDEPLTWEVHHDRDAFKELWLKFENEHRRFPLYPGESTWLTYSYRVFDVQWGDWFQRAVRVPTRRLAVALDFPAELRPSVWGLETSTTGHPQPFRTAIQRTEASGRITYAWATEDPPLHSRYRLEWSFGVDDGPAGPGERPSDVMARLGIVQRGDPLLEQVAQPFDLPAEEDDARRIIAEMHAMTERVKKVHTFGKGIGLAAPQIGINRAAAIVRPPGDEDVIVLLNPQVAEVSGLNRLQYEGCLSLFDYRGQVVRPTAIEVAHERLDGTKAIACFSGGIARLVLHELDHLKGTLYPERMRSTDTLIPVEEYGGTGMNWK